MSTIYTFHQECPTVTTPASGDMVLLYDTSAGTTGKVALSALTGAGRIISGTDTTASITTVAQTFVTHTTTNTNVTIGDYVIAQLNNGSNTALGAVLNHAMATAGFINFRIFNAATTATLPFNGTFVINYAVFRPT